MPVLQTNPELKKLYLPSFEEVANEEDKGWVVMDISPRKAGDIAGVQRGMGEAKIGISMLVGRIKEWNFTDEQGVALEITLDTVMKLHMDDFYFLQKQLVEVPEEISTEEKKTSNPTSQHSETTEIPVQ